MKKAQLIAAAFLYLLISGCGADGPPGSNGPQGPQGNANVVGITLSAPTWDSTTTPHAYFYGYLTIPALDSSILQGGGIEIFYSYNNDSSWESIPQAVYFTGGISYAWSDVITVNQIELDWTYQGTGTCTNPNTVFEPNTLNFKVVCIAPSARNEYPHTNWKDYQQIKAILKKQGTLEASNIIHPANGSTVLKN
jgi:hypothetical protein